jgi:hypothetical protein
LTIKTARQLKFFKLDETASRTEDGLKSKVIIGLVAAAAFYNWIFRMRFVAAPQQEEAANEMFVAQQNFQKQLME